MGTKMLDVYVQFSLLIPCLQCTCETHGLPGLGLSGIRHISSLICSLFGPDNARGGVRGSGLYGADATGKPRELSIEEDARRRYLELVAQEKLAKQQRVQR
jgi:hypothetical protein